MSASELKISPRKCMVWTSCALIVLVVIFFTYSDHISMYGVRRLLDTTTINQKAAVPWWEADDCQCESPACSKPLVTFQGMTKNNSGGSCSHRAWAAGDGQRILSFSLYGNNSGYWSGLNQILPQVEQLYPGWKVRLYTDPRGREAVLCPLLHRHPSLLFVCDITNLPPPLGDISDVHPMLWRAAPLGDPQVAVMGVRDSDSQVSEREAAAVKAWLASDKEFHVMRDHPYHGVPVLGGTWGARWDADPEKTGSMMRTLRKQLLCMGTGQRRKGHDQTLLRMVMWPAMKGRVVAHDSYTCRSFKGSSPWPTQRINKTYVGAIRFRGAKKDPVVPKQCPEACRPRDHPDWLYC